MIFGFYWPLGRVRFKKAPKNVYIFCSVHNWTKSDQNASLCSTHLQNNRLAAAVEVFGSPVGKFSIIISSSSDVAWSDDSSSVPKSCLKNKEINWESKNLWQNDNLPWNSNSTITQPNVRFGPKRTTDLLIELCWQKMYLENYIFLEK